MTAIQNGWKRKTLAVSTKNAGSMTNSPRAKLIVCDVCHSSETDQRSGVDRPVASPATEVGKKSPIGPARCGGRGA